MHEWLKDYFKNEIKNTASKFFEVLEAADACRVLDIYRFLEPVLHEKILISTK